MTSRIIPAAEALRLPSATLTADEEKIVDKILGELDAYVREKMKLSGFEYRTNCNNPTVMFEVVQQLQDAGYVVQCQPILQQNRFNPSGPPTLEGYAMSVAPSRESYLASRRTIQ